MAHRELGDLGYDELLRHCCGAAVGNHDSDSTEIRKSKEFLSQRGFVWLEKEVLTNHPIMWSTKIVGFPQRSDHAAAAVGQGIYSFGGYNGTGPISYSRDGALDVFVLNVNVNEDETKWKLLLVNDNDFIPNQRWGHSAVAYNEFVLIFGGFDMKTNEYSNSTHLFDTKTLKWEEVKVSGHVPKPRADHSAVLVGNEMIIFGGLGTTNDLYSLNLATFHWSTIKTKGIPPSRRYSHSATVYKDNFVFIFGGFDDKGLLSNDLFCFDVNSKEWIHLITSGTSPQGRRGHSAFVQNGLIFLLGGISSSGSCLSDLFCLNPEICEWKEVEPIKPPPSPRGYFGCVALDNRAFLFGGWNYNKVDL